MTLDGGQVFDHLQDALTAAEAGAELRLCPGLYRGEFVAAVPVRMIALEGRDATLLAGASGEAPTLTVPGGSELVGLTVQGGYGGVLMSSAGSLRIEASRITGNHAEHGAGLVVTEGGTVTLLNTEIIDNIARTGGGGAWVQPGGTLELTEGSTVSGNQAGTFGGGVWLQDARLVGGTVSHNLIGAGEESLPRIVAGAVVLANEVFGGAGVALSGTGSVTGTEIAWNIGVGGSMSVSRGTGTLTDVWVHDNDARPSMGGGLGVAEGIVLGEGATRFERNMAAQGAGGAVFGGSVKHATFSDNIGGGLHMAYGELEDVVIERNTSDFAGGLYAVGTGRLDRVEIRDNQSAGPAGGIYVTGFGSDATFEIVSSSITGNAADKDGGGVQLAPSGDAHPLIVRLTDSIVADNTAAKNGGGLFLGSAALVSGGAITGNTAASGGGAYLDWGGSLSVEVTDLGIQEGDNTPDDVVTRVGEVYADFGAGAAFTCDDHVCTQTP